MNHKSSKKNIIKKTKKVKSRLRKTKKVKSRLVKTRKTRITKRKGGYRTSTCWSFFLFFPLVTVKLSEKW